ncbi:MAG TPA: helix-turn-helix transcriptional regulator [bacterium]|nr:helix-turn-helix transcriptional regulator [bacterium]
MDDLSATPGKDDGEKVQPAAPIRVRTLNLGEKVYALICADTSTVDSFISLTMAERHVILGILRGESNREIARRRGTSENTIANQTAAIFRKFEVASRAELVSLLMRTLTDRAGKTTSIAR